MRHLQNLSGSWNVSCGILSNVGTWDFDTCTAALLPDEDATDCLCSTPGTFAVFLTARAARVSITPKKAKFRIFIIIIASLGITGDARRERTCELCSGFRLRHRAPSMRHGVHCGHNVYREKSYVAEFLKTSMLDCHRCGHGDVYLCCLHRPSWRKWFTFY